MNKRVLRMLLIVLTITISMSSVGFASPINVYYFGEKVELPIDPIIENERVLVPMRATFEAMSIPVEWNNATRTVIVRKDSLEVLLPIGSKYAKFIEWDWDVQDEVERMVKLDVPAKIVNGHTLVPLRFVSESLGRIVEWDNKTKSVYIE